VLTDDSKRVKMSAAGAQMQPGTGTAYLKGFKEKILGDQIERYEKIRRVHMTFRLNGYDSPQGVRALSRAEAIVKQVYQEQLVTQEELKTRDLVIERIKTAFYNQG